ncbi:MAG: hypothetical protein PHH26_00630 [Candidatus Thermoplasmatota archaeon]|nr:hypothetical protein [Candidatus Thermoplasmatota archaeon]
MSTLIDHSEYLSEYVRSGLVEIESIEVQDYNGCSPPAIVLMSDIRTLLEKTKDKINELKKEITK